MIRASDILHNLGFKTWDEYVAFWAKENTRSGRYVAPTAGELSIIEQAARGQRFELGKPARDPPTEPSRGHDSSDAFSENGVEGDGANQDDQT